MLSCVEDSGTFDYVVSKHLMQPGDPLPRGFYERPADQVASALLGHWLVRRVEGRVVAGLITETEAYLHDDPACHAAPGPTQRNRAMFGPGGHAYIYLIYGLHYCVNAVCQPAGTGEAVLIRAIETRIGIEQVKGRRGNVAEEQLTNGPAKVCQALDITRVLDGADLTGFLSPLAIHENLSVKADRKQLGPVITSTRIGITKAADLRLRFYLARAPVLRRDRKAELRLKIS